MLKSLPTLLLLLSLLGVRSLTNNYHINSIKDTIHNGFKETFATAKYNGSGTYYLKPKSIIAETLNMTVLYESNTEFTVKIQSGDAPPRFSMPYEFPFSYTKTKPDDCDDPEYGIEINKEPLSFKVQRTSTRETIFDTSAFDLIYSEFFLTFGTTLPSKYFYGMGERRTRNFLYNSGIYTIWCKDQFAQIDDGLGNQETYGAHPVYLMREASGNWHVVFLRTTNALDFHFDSSNKTLKYLITGGIIELKFFLGNQYPETAINMYHNYINRWTVMPFWSFGYHQSRWGYLYLQELVEVVDKMQEFDLPIDVIWSDIDYMVNFTDFTVDQERYNIDEFRKLLERVRWVPIVDSGVFIDQNAPAYQVGTEYDVWIRSARNQSNYLVGVVWPGKVHWPDWLHPNASRYWGEMLEILYSFVPFSGIWIDMNENSNFCQGEYPYDCFTLTNYLPQKQGTKTRKSNPEINIIRLEQPEVTRVAEMSPFYDMFEFVDFDSTSLPYVPGNVALEYHGLSLNALHYGNVLNFDFHNLDPFFEAFYTYQGQLNLSNERPFVLTRGNFVGSGQFAAHWSGDNAATWDFLQLSIPELFNMQLFGISMGGADICGFADDADEELCARWMQLGAFYPFMRNHNQIGTISQEPYSMGVTLVEASRAALLFRYSILKFYYSIYIRHNGLGTIFRPLFFDFPFDENLLNLQTQFLIGSELMVAAAVYPGVDKVLVYFPSGSRWYDFRTGKRMIEVDDLPINIMVNVPLDEPLPVFIKGGTIVHTQDVAGVRRTDDLTNVFNLVIALTPVTETDSVAFGQIMGITNYLDSESVDKCLGENDCLVNIAVEAVINDDGSTDVRLSIDPNTPRSMLEDVYISNITFYGVRSEKCDMPVAFCNWSEYVAKCESLEPLRVKYGTFSFRLTKEGCQRYNFE